MDTLDYKQHLTNALLWWHSIEGRDPTFDGAPDPNPYVPSSILLRQVRGLEIAPQSLFGKDTELFIALRDTVFDQWVVRWRWIMDVGIGDDPNESLWRRRATVNIPLFKMYLSSYIARYLKVKYSLVLLAIEQVYQGEATFPLDNPFFNKRVHDHADTAAHDEALLRWVVSKATLLGGDRPMLTSALQRKVNVEYIKQVYKVVPRPGPVPDHHSTPTHTTPTHTTPTHTDPVPSKKVEESDSPQSLFWIVVLIIGYILMQAYVNKKR